jgi:hypothetical protein
MQPSDLVAYVDVDDTLVRQTGTKRIPMVAVVEHVRQLHQAGVTLFCWSAGGAEYSRRTARELGIESLFTGFLPKPHVLLDDQPPSEWPNCIVAVPAGLASASVDGHLAALARRESASAGAPARALAWTFSATPLTGPVGLRITCARAGVMLRGDEVMALWREDERFCAAWNAQLAATPYAAFRWELPALTAVTATRPFECVVLDSPELARAPDRSPFAAWFDRAGTAPVIEFGNLGGDAILVAPCPQGEPAAYVHLGVFVRQAPPAQQLALWAAVGGALQRRVGERPVWLNTAGAGVAWLHVRLDDRPKYYGYAPYRS